MEETHKAFVKGMEYSPQKVTNTLKQDKPECLSDALWQAVSDNARQKLKKHIEEECRYSKDAPSILRSYNLDALLPETQANALRKSVTDEYVMLLLREMRMSKEPLKKLAKLDLQDLSKEQAQELQRTAYSAQKEWVLPSLSDQAAVKDFVASGRPDWLSDEDFARLSAIALQYDEFEKANEQRLQALETERAEMETAKGKYQICIQAVQDLVLTGKVDDQYSTAFRGEDWGRLKLIEKSWNNESHPPSSKEQEPQIKG
jgi:hypothetical protein